ncbi:101 kDa malaria antigen-like [Helianthus annuus]|uniref:101 kDa malaria antigen-like n=1 Tax=Helianthus annuus TaxID=4232 RepID=UPI000B905506|nr:101 kDa malaria antigen-like [Helianthus annuus]
MPNSGEEFYNTFYNAFTSESSDRRSELKEYSREISENLKFENMYGSQQKPPKLMKIEDFNWWKNRFEGWVKAFAPESWLKLVSEYKAPVKEGGELIDEKDFTEKDIKEVVTEYRMITLIKQSLKEVFEASLPKVVEMRKRKEEELKKLIEEVKADAKTAAEKAQKSEEKGNAEEKEGKKEKAVEDQKAEKEDLVLKENEMF